MHIAKQKYVGFVHALAASQPFAGFGAKAEASSPYGLRRWAASLLAIYDTASMVKLDCPWWNVAATREIDEFLASRPDARVFEYGSGASTAWLARRAAHVTSVEHNVDWLRKFETMLEPCPNTMLLYRSIANGPEDYVEAIAENDDHYDIIVVDGRHRALCLDAALGRLRPGGIVLFDDSGRRRYRKVIDNCRLKEDHHFGRSFCVPYPDHTSILRHG